jgi:hypothetical protein
MKFRFGARSPDEASDLQANHIVPLAFNYLNKLLRNAQPSRQTEGRPPTFAVYVLLGIAKGSPLVAAVPCPPPVLAVDGGTPVKTTCKTIASVEASNLAATPPLVPDENEACTVTLLFKPVLLRSQHSYLVITRPDGTKTEVRGGPSKIGREDRFAIHQPSGNPFKCKTNDRYGVVAPYVGLHGLLGQDEKGTDVYSPDGNVATPAHAITIDKSIHKTSCALANCLMQAASSNGKSCQPYDLDTAKMRNSNTLVFTSLTACGVKDPLPLSVSAPGWYTPWVDE